MTITERLRLELFVRECLKEHGDEFYTELARILERIENDEEVDTRGKPLATFSLRWR